MPKPKSKPRQWYAWAKVFRGLPLELQQKVFHDKGTRCQIAHLAVLHPTFGTALDDAYAPLRVCIYVCWPPDLPERPRMVLQKERLDRAMNHFLAAGRWPSHATLRGWRAEEARATSALRRGAAPAPPSADVGVEHPANADWANVLATLSEHQDPEAAAVLRALAEKRSQESGTPKSGC